MLGVAWCWESRGCQEHQEREPTSFDRWSIDTFLVSEAWSPGRFGTLQQQL